MALDRVKCQSAAPDIRVKCQSATLDIRVKCQSAALDIKVKTQIPTSHAIAEQSNGPKLMVTFSNFKIKSWRNPFPFYYSSQFSIPVTYDAQCRQSKLPTNEITHLRPVNDTMHTTHCTTRNDARTS